MIIFKEAKKIVLRGLIDANRNQYFFAEKNSKGNEKPKTGLSEESLGNYQGLVYNMRKDANLATKQRTEQRALFKYNKRVQDHLVQLTLYMQHNQWKSQFIYLLLNYYKLGFKVVSDYAFLDSSSYMLELRNKKQEQRWPTVRCIIGLNPRVIVTGTEEIQKFFVDNLYFSQSFLSQSQENEYAKKFIDQEILPNMQSLLWHPTLTYQTTFHTDLYYHQSEQKNYMLVEILIRNFKKCSKAVFSNMFKIMKEKERYLNSKENFTKSLREISDLYLKNKQYFGGQKPSFIDFYLFAHLKTKWESKYFKLFIQEQISDQFKRWVLRMGWNCEYSRQRVTVL